MQRKHNLTISQGDSGKVNILNAFFSERFTVVPPLEQDGASPTLGAATR